MTLFTKRMLPFFIGMLFLSTVHAKEEQSSLSATWNGSLPGGFSVGLVISNLSPTISDVVTVDLNLTYPKNFSPDLDAIRRTLLSHSDFTEPPFVLTQEVKSTVKEPADGILQQHIVFTLSPQLNGIHALTLREITFVPKDKGDGTATKLLTPIFRIKTTTPSLDFDPYALIAPLMPMTKKLPITLSSTNRRAYTQNKELAALATSESSGLIKQKQFPWVWVLLIVVCGIVWLLIVYAPESFEKKKRSKEYPPALPAQMTALQALERLSPKKIDSLYFHELDKIVRKYFHQRYAIDIYSSTTQDILKDTKVTKIISPQLRTALIAFFEINDKRKFCDYIPADADKKEAEKQARYLIQQAESSDM